MVGLIYGMPIGNIMPVEWQNTFVTLGYIGLILIIFEGQSCGLAPFVVPRPFTQLTGPTGGLTVRLDLLKKNFLLSASAATVGVVVPIALCYLLLYLGFGYGASRSSLGSLFLLHASR
jgi:hypothetical protein